MISSEDRFKELSYKYDSIFKEIFSAQGLDYNLLQKSVLFNVAKIKPNFRKLSILDIGTGDGETLKSFVEAGCAALTGIDINKEMLNRARFKLGKNVNLLLMDATDLSRFKKHDFPIIISGNCIHNISKKERIRVWKEIVRLKPELIVIADKICDKNFAKHKLNYDAEIRAIVKVIDKKYHLHKLAGEWLNHHAIDEKRKLSIDEIKLRLKKYYKIKITLEMGMNKIFIAL